MYDDDDDLVNAGPDKSDIPGNHKRYDNNGPRGRMACIFVEVRRCMEWCGV